MSFKSLLNSLLLVCSIYSQFGNNRVIFDTICEACFMTQFCLLIWVQKAKIMIPFENPTLLQISYIWTWKHQVSSNSSARLMFFSWCVQLTHKAGAADLSLALSLRLVSWPNFVCSFGFRNEDKQFVKQLTQKSDNLIGRTAVVQRFPEGDLGRVLQLSRFWAVEEWLTHGR